MMARDSTRPDQAEGLRRLQASPLRSLCTVLFAGERCRKPALMQRLGQSMASRGRQVLWIDALPANSSGAASAAANLVDVAQGRVALDQAATPCAPGLRRIALGDLAHEALLTTLMRELAAQGHSLLVDAELDAAGQLPLSVLAEGELVLQVEPGTESEAGPDAIREAYQIMRSLKALCMPGALSLLVSGVSPARARQVQANLFHAASRYLAMPVRTIVPSGVPSQAVSPTVSRPRHV